MTTKDLVFVANLILDCEEKLHDGHQPILDYIRERCAFYKVPEVEDHVVRIVNMCIPVYNIGTVKQEFVSISTDGVQKIT